MKREIFTDSSAKETSHAMDAAPEITVCGVIDGQTQPATRPSSDRSGQTSGAPRTSGGDSENSRSAIGVGKSTHLSASPVRAAEANSNDSKQDSEADESARMSSTSSEPGHS